MACPVMHDDTKLAFHDGSCCRCGTKSNLLRFTEFGKAVCSDCYPAFFRRRMARTLSRYQMIRKKETLGVAVSGGKDSGALLHVLHTLRHSLGLLRVTALHVHMGLGDYSDHSLATVEELTNRLGVPLVIERLIDHQIAITPVGTFAFCSVCGAVRRALFDRMGLKEGWAAIATGHTLDDRLQQMLKRLLTGRLDAPKPVLPESVSHPRKIKPLSFIPDRAVEAYVHLEKIPVCSMTCPHFSPDSHRFKQVFELLENLAPSSKVQVALTLGRAMNRVGPEQLEKPCPDCGNPTNSTICPLCRLRRFITSEQVTMNP